MKGPEIFSSKGSFKLEYVRESDGARLTVYDDGIWQFEQDALSDEGRILRLQDIRWYGRMINAGIDNRIAWWAVQFFKGLRCK